MKNQKSICNKCNSYRYCANREKDMEACINFNKFPKETDDVLLSGRDEKTKNK